MQSGARIRTVDGLRGLAALLVVFDHTVGDGWGLGAWSQQNHGIAVFAILTGFLLSGPFLRARLGDRRDPRLREFLRARVARIYPGYWVALAVAALLIGLNSMGPGDEWRVITLTQTFGTDSPFEGIPPAWSLSLFLTFYLSLPLWSWARRRLDGSGRSDKAVLQREVAFLLVLVAGSLVVRAFSLTDSFAEDPAFTLLGRADWFALGMFLAVLVAARERGISLGALLEPGRRPALALATAAGLTAASAFVPVHLEEARDQLDTLAAGLLVAGMVLHGTTLRGPQRILASRPWRALGRWSYGIFLYGYIAQKLVAELEPGMPLSLRLAITVAMAIGLGAASWRFVERPASRYLRRRRDSRERLAPQPAAA
jgi:peptidoglycan/LPS O-acetylase OafA/YrhL